MLRSAFLIALILLATTPGQAGVWRPAQRVLVRVSAPSPADREASLYASRFWNVDFRGEELYVSARFSDEIKLPALPFRPNVNTTHLGYYGTLPASALHIRNTWLLSYDRGEFGGGLWQFSGDGRIGHRLLDEPAAALQPYGSGAIVETGVASPFFLRPLRIHYFALQNALWSETSHADFKEDIWPLVHIGSRLFGIVHLEKAACGLAELSMSATLQMLWRTERCPSVVTVTRSAAGDFALGAHGYVIRLRRRGASMDAAWYAPPDCISYANDRCIAASGSQPFYRRELRPGRLLAFSNDGAWMLLRSQQLLHFKSGLEAKVVPLPPHAATTYFLAIAAFGDDIVLNGSDSVWLRRSGQWKSIALHSGPCVSVTLQAHGAWCLAADRGSIKRIGFESVVENTITFTKPLSFVVGGSLDDIWFADESSPALGHISQSGTLEGFALKAPAISLSRTADATWFTESDGIHYGFIDARDTLHETSGGQYTTIKSVSGAPHGAWVRETYADSFIVRHNAASASLQPGPYLAGVRRFIVTNDGALWSLSSEYPTIERMTEDGSMARYSLPCADQHVQLAAAPENGVWFLSDDAGCSGVIDGAGVHVRNLPAVQTVLYR